MNFNLLRWKNSSKALTIHLTIQLIITQREINAAVSEPREDDRKYLRIAVNEIGTVRVSGRRTVITMTGIKHLGQETIDDTFSSYQCGSAGLENCSISAELDPVRVSLWLLLLLADPLQGLHQSEQAEVPGSREGGLHSNLTQSHLPTSEPVENDWEGAGGEINEEGSVLHLGWGKTGVRVEHPAQQRVRDLGQSSPAGLKHDSAYVELQPVSQSGGILLLDHLGELRQAELLGQGDQQLQVQVRWGR